MGTLKVNHIQPTTGSIVTVDSTLVVTGNASIVGDAYVTGTLHARTTDFVVSSNSTVLGDAAGDVTTVTGQLTASRGLIVPDDMKLRFGAGEGDATFEYDENGTDTLLYAGSSLRISDDTKLEFGNGGDATIEYDENGTDELRFAGAAATFEQAVTFDAAVTLGNAAGDVSTVPGQLTASRGLIVPDDMKLRFGAGAGDATIEYDENGTDELRFAGAAVTFEQDVTFDEDVVLGESAGDVTTVTGQLTASRGLVIPDDMKLRFGSATSGDATFEYDEDASDTLLYSGASLRISDDTKLQFGSSGDVSIEYDENGTDELRFSGREVTFEQDTSFDGDVTLGDAGSDITVVTGRLTGSRGMLIPDDIRLRFGTGGDATIEYDENGTDELRFAGAAVTFEQDVTFDNDVVLGVAAGDVTTATGNLTASRGMNIPDDMQLRFGGGGSVSSGDAHIRYDETSNDFLVISGSAKGTAISGSLVKVHDLLAVGKHTNSTSKESGIFVVNADEGDTTNGLIATFKSNDADYCRLNIDNSTANGDTQFTFMSQNSSKWSVGNMGSNETFHIKSGFGDFEDTDPFVLTTTDLSINTRLTASRGLLVPDDMKLRFGAGSGDATIEYDENGSDQLRVAGSATIFEQGITGSQGIIMPDDVLLRFGNANGGDATIEYDENGTDELRFAGAAVTFEQDVTFDNDVVLGVAAGDVTTVTGRLTASRGLLVPDDMRLRFGAGAGDATIEYDENDTNKLVISGSAAGLALSGSLIQMGSRNADSFVQVTGSLATSDDLLIGGSIKNAGSGDIILDSAQDIRIDAAGGNVEFKDAGTSILTLDMDTVANTAILKHEVDNNAANIQFRQANNLVTAMSMDWTGYGAFGYKKPISTITSALDLSSVTNALTYLGATILVSTAGSAYSITLPTTTDADEAKQMQGWHIRVLVLDAQGSTDAAITVIRGDTTNDMIFGNVYAADEAAASSQVTIGSNVITFVSPCPSTNFVDITCVAASTTSMSFHATGFAMS